MDDKSTNNDVRADKKPRLGCLQILGIIGMVFLVAVLIMVVWVKTNLYASKFTPVELNTSEQEVLKSKLAVLEESAQKDLPGYKKKEAVPRKPLEPEPYSEAGLKREISLTEKELNAIIASDPEIARMVALDLSEDLVSVKLVVPVDEEVPVLGGKTLKFSLGVILSFDDGHPVVALKGISIGGIPIPNAWLGYIKEKNLIDEFGSEEGFWQLFAAGVKDLKVEKGNLLVKLNE